MTLTIEIPASDDPRVTEAFGSILNLKDQAGEPVDATPENIQDTALGWINQQTMDYERRKNQAEFVPPPLEAMRSLE